MALQPSLQVQRAFAESWKLLPPGGRALLAVSGGLDSMVLLECAARFASGSLKKQSLLVVHVNHALRGAESDGDEALVLARARELGIEARAVRLDWEAERPSQDLCRRKREAVFALLFASPADRVFLAHHLNDQAETVFLRLLRGTGARGLRGMLPASGRKLRPFLALEKATLLAAAREWNILWREDSSNQNLHYDRNWLRSLFPQIETRRPGFQGKLAALAEEARGWGSPLAENNSIDEFHLAEGVSFSRPAPGISGSALSERFRLGRAHTTRLLDLLAKPAGKAEAEGVRFWWSAGVLLAERGDSFYAGLSRPREKVWSSALGEWRADRSFRPLAEGGKKEFQALRVPLFFRPAIPLVRIKEGKAIALLPKRLEKTPGIHFNPSPLAQWWLNPNPNQPLNPNPNQPLNPKLLNESSKPLTL